MILITAERERARSRRTMFPRWQPCRCIAYPTSRTYPTYSVNNSLHSGLRQIARSSPVSTVTHLLAITLGLDVDRNKFLAQLVLTELLVTSFPRYHELAARCERNLRHACRDGRQLSVWSPVNLQGRTHCKIFKTRQFKRIPKPMSKLSLKTGSTRSPTSMMKIRSSGTSLASQTRMKKRKKKKRKDQTTHSSKSIHPVFRLTTTLARAHLCNQ